MEIRTVLCPVDFTGKTGRELALAKQVCGHFGARLVVEHNLDPRPPNFLTVTWMWSEEFEGQEELKQGSAQEKLRGLLDELAQSLECEAKLTRGPIDDVLLLLVKDLPADLLIMGSHGWSTAEHRSLTEKMISKCPIPVLTVGNAEGDPPLLFGSDRAEPLRILATVDDENHPDSAVAYAGALAQKLGATLVLLEVFPEGSDSGTRAKRLAKAEGKMKGLLGDRADLSIEPKAVAGHQVEAILALATEEDVDLIVRPVHTGIMPKAKRRHYADLELLHTSPCPVLFVPQKFDL